MVLVDRPESPADSVSSTTGHQAHRRHGLASDPRGHLYARATNIAGSGSPSTVFHQRTASCCGFARSRVSSTTKSPDGSESPSALSGSPAIALDGGSKPSTFRTNDHVTQQSGGAVGRGAPQAGRARTDRPVSDRGATGGRAGGCRRHRDRHGLSIERLGPVDPARQPPHCRTRRDGFSEARLRPRRNRGNGGRTAGLHSKT